MKRSSAAAGIVLALLVAVVVLVTDPWGWFGRDRPSAGPVPAQEHDPAPVPAPELAGDGQPDVLAPAGEDPKESQRTTAAPAEPARATFRFVVDGDRPVADAQVLLARSGALLGDRRTDAQGEVAFDADERAAELFVAVARRPLERREVALEAGRHTVALADGARVSGRCVRDDGGAPGELALLVESDGVLSPEAPAEVEAALAVPVLRNFATIATDAGGAFEMAGLPATWSGRLAIRGSWKVVEASQGELDALTGGVQLARPATDVVLRITPRRSLRGRLVLRDSGEPVPEAQLIAVLRAPGSEMRDGLGAQTRPDGRFELEVRMETIGWFELHLGAITRAHPALLALDGSALPADGELGDVFVDGVRHVPFVLLDPPGRPIPGGVAVAGTQRSAPTGRDGQGELRWVPREVQRMAVEARGFAPAEVELPPIVAAPLVVTLQPANELVVRLALPDGAAPGQFKVVLRGEERITAAPITQDLGDGAHVSDWAYPPLALRKAKAGTYLAARPSDPGAEVAFRALRAGVGIALEVHGIGAGEAVYHRERVAPLGPTEHRTLDVALSGALVVFRGRVLSADGTALVRASLQLDNQILGWTDAQGGFVCVLDGPHTGTLLVSHQACATKYLRDYVVPTDGRPVEFRLSPAHSVTVEVVDERGRPVPQAEVWVEYQGFTTNTHRAGENRFVAQSVPEERFTLNATVGGRAHRQEHDPAVPEARIVVPVQGRVAAQVSAATTASRNGTFQLHLEPPAGVDAEPQDAMRPSAPGLRLEIAAVQPGSYRASLRYVPSDEERKSGRAVEVSDVVTVEVEPDRESVIQLALPGG